MAKTASKGTSILAGRATLYEPTDRYKTWRIVYKDPITGKRKTTSGGATPEEAEAKVAGLLGDFVPSHQQKGYRPPTVRECADVYLNDGSDRWGDRTREHYLAFTKKINTVYGDTPITKISPDDIAKINLSTLSRGQRKRFRTVVRGVFTAGEAHLRESAEAFAKAVPLAGSKSSDPMLAVSRGDIPSIRMVASSIVTAFHTNQIGLLDPEGTELNPLTGEKNYPSAEDPTGGMFADLNQLIDEWQIDADFIEPDHSAFTSGLPETVTVEHRADGLPPQWGAEAKASWRERETEKIAKAYRQAGLVTVLGAGAGVRIGETLALRPRHFLTRKLAGSAVRGEPLCESGFRGAIDIVEQVTRTANHGLTLSPPKMGKERRTHLPAFLPSWSTTQRSRTPLREHIGSVIPRFSDPRVSLWEATEEEVKMLWQSGFTPLGWLLWQRFVEMGIELSEKAESEAQHIGLLMNMLVFPTPTTGRRREGEAVHRVSYPDNWKHEVASPEGTGTYYSSSNFSSNFSNRLYDYVGGLLKESPAHRRNANIRKGWTHHGLRHFCISSRISAGTPLTFVADEAGHHNASFTLARYGHSTPFDLDSSIGYEY